MTPTEKPKGRQPRKRKAYLNPSVRSPSLREDGRAWLASARADGNLVFRPRYGREEDVRELPIGRALDAAICNAGVVVGDSQIRAVVTLDGVVVTRDHERPCLVTYRDLIGLIGPIKQPTLL